ncbi:MAG: winged helix-turn-helix transcriptional regulator [Nitrososphaerales archaeon]|nr:winged helix-turn-helix transcriptional regulator [Nitrososphaerales archaeon]
MSSMMGAASNPERQAILRALQKGRLTFKALGEMIQMRPEILQEHLDRLVRSSLVLPPNDGEGYFQISSMGRIVLEDLKLEKPKKEYLL